MLVRLHSAQLLALARALLMRPCPIRLAARILHPDLDSSSAVDEDRKAHDRTHPPGKVDTCALLHSLCCPSLRVFRHPFPCLSPFHAPSPPFVDGISQPPSLPKPHALSRALSSPVRCAAAADGCSPTDEAVEWSCALCVVGARDIRAVLGSKMKGRDLEDRRSGILRSRDHLFGGHGDGRHGADRGHLHGMQSLDIGRTC